jgi:hypothetical protein
MYLTLHEEVRAWKGFDFRVLDRLYEKGFIRDPKSKARSVVLTEAGRASSEELFKKHFGHRQSRAR